MGLAQTPFQMLGVWCFNGLVQSTLWPPVLRVIVESLSGAERERACVNISTTYPAATLFSYLACPAILLILPWRGVFFLFSLFIFAVAALWLPVFRKMEASRPPPPGDEAPSGGAPYRKRGRKPLPVAVLALFCLALTVQGALRDGLSAWIPAYTAQTFSLETGTAIFSSSLLPVVNLLGIYAARFLYRLLKDEARTSACIFCASALAALFLRFSGAAHLALALSAFALITAGMVGVNLMLVSLVPARFSRRGLTPFISGFTNSMVYLGSSVSSFSIALGVNRLGWGPLILVLAGLALLGALLCLIAAPRWRAFLRREFAPALPPWGPPSGARKPLV
jgi:OPA family glycerol-3-phosphate transporter-like MFS transporter